MPKSKKEKPEQNWVWLSAMMTIVTIFLMFIYPEKLRNIASLIIFLSLWILLFVYVLANNFRNFQNSTRKKYFLWIAERKFEGGYFLTMWGIIFLLVVIIINYHFGEAWGIAVFSFLFGLIALGVFEILKRK